MNNENTIVVTGASSGIGRATASRLLENDYHVIGIARDFSKCPVDSKQFTTLELDLSRLDELPARLDELARDQPSISGLVCCAGSGRFGSLEEFSFEQIRELIDLNLTSQVYVVRALLPAMKRRQAGTIAQSLRQECASSDLRVSIINPGMVKTGFFDTLDFRPGDAHDNYILPEDVAAVVLEVIETRSGTVIDEINLSPQKKVIHFKK
jgi:short-subunit dehydrogenase